MELELNDFDGANSLLGPMDGVVPENLDFLEPIMALALLVVISGP
jgi:hypothetical protein